MSSDSVKQVFTESQNRITNFILNLARIATESRLETIGFIHVNEPMEASTYIEILGRADMIPYGENIMCTLNSIESLFFTFVTGLDDNDNLHMYCLINTPKEPLAVFKITNTDADYSTMSDFLLICDDCVYDWLEHFLYRHICGIILNYVKLTLIKYPLLYDLLIYILAEYPGTVDIVNLEGWAKNRVVD